MKRTRSTARSHGGCGRCKERKVKCDETKPACLVCSRAGEECPGYGRAFKWVRKHERFAETTNRPREDDDEGRDRGGSLSQRRIEPEHATTPIDHDGLLDPMLGTWNEDATLQADLADLLYGNGLYDGLGHPDMAPQDPNLQWLQLPLSDMSGLTTYPDGSNPKRSDDHERSCVPTMMRNIFRRPGSVSSQSTSRPQSSSPPGSLLEAYYRLSCPTPTAQFSDSDLEKHYFAEVCSLFSCFDSDMNPSRTLVLQELPRSPTIHFAIQSMAIAHLANHYPYMAPLGLAKRSQAWRLLQLDLRRHRSGQVSLQSVLLSLLLMGLSVSWHQPLNLGLQYLFIARTLMQCYFRSNWTTSGQVRLSEEKFFLDALMYWEMLASFVDPVPMTPFPGYGRPALPVPNDSETRKPHSWTGLMPELYWAMAEIGRVLRRRQRRSTMNSQLHSDVLSAAKQDEEWAATLQDFLLDLRLPGEDTVTDYGDANTPKSDLVRAAHAYRYIGLIEIYGAFPRLLEDKLNEGKTFPPCYDHDFTRTDANRPHGDSWLQPAAIEILDVVKEISISSSACRLLPLILVSCGTQLRQSETSATEDSDAQNDIIDIRYQVEARMLALSRKYPQRQMLHILDIIKEVWQRLDDGLQNAHWMDVMHERKLQTMLG